MNELINEALHDHVSRRSHDVEKDLKKTLTPLRAYRRRDPRFETAIASAARAEAEHGHSDSLDGEVAIGELVDGRMAAEAGPVEAEIRRLLHG